jgi:hypothetical protein
MIEQDIPAHRGAPPRQVARDSPRIRMTESGLSPPQAMGLEPQEVGVGGFSQQSGAVSEPGCLCENAW